MKVLIICDSGALACAKEGELSERTTNMRLKPGTTLVCLLVFCLAIQARKRFAPARFV